MLRFARGRRFACIIQCVSACWMIQATPIHLPNAPIMPCYLPTIQVYDSFYTYWNTTIVANPMAIYDRSTITGTDAHLGGHAVIVAGYSNQQNNPYWLVQTSCESGIPVGPT